MQGARRLAIARVIEVTQTRSRAMAREVPLNEIADFMCVFDPGHLRSVKVLAMFPRLASTSTRGVHPQVADPEARGLRPQMQMS